MSHKRKYRIHELLESLSLRKHKVAIRILPGILNVSPATFSNFRNIAIDDKQDIPHQKVDIMERFFGLAPGQLAAYEPEPVRPISAIDDDGNEVDFNPTKFGLSK